MVVHIYNKINAYDIYNTIPSRHFLDDIREC